MGAVATPHAVAWRRRAYVAVSGPDAADYLQRMVSNDVQTLAVGASCDALLLTAKARIVATLRILRRGDDDFLLLTEPWAGDSVADLLLRARFAARVEITSEEHRSLLLLGEGVEPPADCLVVANTDYGVTGWEVVDGEQPDGVVPAPEEELERLRIRAGTPLLGRELDDRVLPAEAGLVERAVSFTKGCYPGQEPIARLHYRGHVNRSLRVLEILAETLPPADAELLYEGKVVGRVTSAAAEGERVIALGYVRAEVPADARLFVGEAVATMVAPSRP